MRSTMLVISQIILAALALLLDGSMHSACANGTIDAKAEAIVNAHIAARGGADRFAAIQSLSFLRTKPDGKDDARPSMIKMKPHYSVAGCSAPECGYAEGFDGEHAWEAQPRRQRAYQARGEAAKAIRRAGAIDFPFIAPRDDAASVNYAGEVVLDGKPVQRINVHMVDGLDQIYYFDPVSHLVVANDRTVPMHARPPQVRQRTFFSEWQPVAGVLYPFHLETRRLCSDGTTRDVIEDGRWSRIDANSATDRALFMAPSVHPAALTQLVLDVYAQAFSLDEATIAQRYDDFAGQHASDVFDTESDLTWLGYELLKDETVGKALAVFDQLVREHPKSSSAWDSVGDGRLQAGDVRGAISAFRQAVELDPKAEESAAKLKTLLSQKQDGALTCASH